MSSNFTDYLKIARKVSFHLAEKQEDIIHF